MPMISVTGDTMKVIIINGSPRKDGNTSIAVGELDKVFRAEGIETETIQIGNVLALVEL